MKHCNSANWEHWKQKKFNFSKLQNVNIFLIMYVNLMENFVSSNYIVFSRIFKFSWLLKYVYVMRRALATSCGGCENSFCYDLPYIVRKLYNSTVSKLLAYKQFCSLPHSALFRGPGYLLSTCSP